MRCNRIAVIPIVKLSDAFRLICLSTLHRDVHVSFRYDRWRNQSCSDGMLIVGGGGKRIAFVVLKRRRETE